MNTKQIERSLYGPSLFEVTLGMILSVALGAALAVCFLMFKPVETVSTLPAEADRPAGQVYYIEGGKDATRAKQWRRKQQTLLEGTSGEIAFLEEELNAAFAAGSEKPGGEKAPPPPRPTPKPAAKPAAGAAAAKPTPEPAAPMPEEVLIVSVPNFRIHDNLLQVGVPSTINLLTLSFPVILQADGAFAKEGDMFMYQPQSIFVGSLPLHRIPGASAYVMKRLMAAQALPEEGMAAWRKVSNIAIEGRSLKITIP